MMDSKVIYLNDPFDLDIRTEQLDSDKMGDQSVLCETVND